MSNPVCLASAIVRTGAGGKSTKLLASVLRPSAGATPHDVLTFVADVRACQWQKSKQQKSGNKHVQHEPN